VTLTAGGEEPPAEWEIMLAQQEQEKSTRPAAPAAAAPAEDAGTATAAAAPAATTVSGTPDAADTDEEAPPRQLLDAEPLPGEEIEEELKVIYKDEDQGRRR
jgi:hypothetical protein